MLSSWSRHEYLETYGLAHAVFMNELREHNRAEIVARVLAETSGRRDTVVLTENMTRMVRIMDLCEDTLGQQPDHPRRYFPAFSRKKRNVS